MPQEMNPVNSIDPITLQQASIRARQYSDLVRLLIDRAKKAVTPAGSPSLWDTLADVGDAAGFGHRAQMGLTNTGSDARPLYQPREGVDFDPSGSAFGGSAPIAASEREILAGPMAARQITGKLRPMSQAGQAGQIGERGATNSMGIGRRGFLKAIPGGALAAKALLSGGEAEAPKAMGQVAKEAATTTTTAATPPLGAAPIRVYERVGNKFVLTHEVPRLPGENPDRGFNTIKWEKAPDGGDQGRVDPKLMDALGHKGRARLVETSTDHPEHQLLAEPGRVDYAPHFTGPVTHFSEVENNRFTDLLEKKIRGKNTGEVLTSAEKRELDNLDTKANSDPYHARLLESQKKWRDVVNRATDPSLKGTVSDREIQDVYKKLYNNDDKGAEWNNPESSDSAQAQHNGEHQTHSYIIEKPVRVRYYEHGRPGEEDSWHRVQQYESNLHPEIYKLPLESKGELNHFGAEDVDRYDHWKTAPRLVGSGDDFAEAMNKANSFFHDIGVDPTQVKWTGGDKIKRATLPNGDMIEIRERPSLRPGYTPKKAGYKNKEK